MLALFDDEYAVVGSANFTHRSMQRDGECDIGVADPVQAKAIREAVFSHWGVAGPTDWRRMDDFAKNPTPGVGVVPVPIEVLDFRPPDRIWKYVSALLDPSDLF